MRTPQDYAKSQYPLTATLILGAGLDPEAILVESITVNGYESLHLIDGKRIKLGGHFLTEKRRWPSTEFGVMVRLCMLNEDTDAAGAEDRAVIRSS